MFDPMADRAGRAAGRLPATMWSAIWDRDRVATALINLDIGRWWRECVARVRLWS